jgi:S1-C subfamily serine protease
LRADESNDLALVKINVSFGAAEVAILRTAPPVRNGEEVIVYGFPLAGLLSSAGNVTGGNISALAGFGDDIDMMQITAPVQPGNSGGPLLDTYGRVIGVVTGRLNDASTKDLGAIPQNVNFAIKATVAANFLDAHGIEYGSSTGSSEILEMPAIADKAKEFTVQVVCETTTTAGQ